MGLTIVHKSDLTARKRNPADRAGAGRRRGHRRGLQARRPEGARRLPGQPQDDRLRHLRRALRRLVPGGAARRRRHPARDAALARGHRRRTSPQLQRARLLQPERRASSPRKPVEFLVDLADVRARAGLRLPGRRRRSCCAHLEEPLAARPPRADASTTCSSCVTPIVDAIGSAREFPFPLAYLPSGLFDNASLERYLRHNIERRGMPNDFRVLYRDAQRRALHRRDEPRHGRARRLRPRRGQLAHDLRGGAGVDRAARLLQAGAHPAASTTSTAACAAPPTSTSPSSTAPTWSSATTRSARSRTASTRRFDPERQHVRRRGPAARRPGHADGAQPGLPHAAALAPPARHPPVPGRSQLPGRHHPDRAGRDRPDVLQHGAARTCGRAAAPARTATSRSPRRSSRTTT